MIAVGAAWVFVRGGDGNLVLCGDGRGGVCGPGRVLLHPKVARRER